MPSTRPPIVPEYDLFVSYAAADRTFAEDQLLEPLGQAGVHCHSAEAYVLGRPWLLEFERAVQKSRFTLLVLSPDYLSDRFAMLVEILATTFGQESGSWPVIPLILRKADLPMRLTALVGLDASDLARWPATYRRLCAHLGYPLPATGSAEAEVLTGLALVGTILNGRYQVQALLGEGPLGSVYRAAHVFTRREVAIKILNRDAAADPVRRQRLLREARAMSLLRHPHIADVTDYGELADGRGYLVMELLVGHTLAGELRRGPLAVPAVVDLGRQMALGLCAAHDAHIVHRDFRPTNIFIVAGQVKIVDFGLARWEGSDTLTAGHAMGAPEYLSPEQAVGQVADARSDQYALGCVLYEMLTGAPPFQGATQAQIMERHTREEVRVPGGDVPAGLTRVVLRALCKDPAARYGSMRELAEALAQVLQPVRVYLGAAEKDHVLRDELMKHLALLERERLIEIFHTGRVLAGGAVPADAQRRLVAAEVVLLLISPDYLASSRSYDEEISPALARGGEAVVVPVLGRAADWERGVLGGLKALPAGGKALMQRRDRDAALREVAQGVREVVAALRGKSP